jgi:hypothetical protein
MRARELEREKPWLNDAKETLSSKIDQNNDVGAANQDQIAMVDRSIRAAMDAATSDTTDDEDDDDNNNNNHPLSVSMPCFVGSDRSMFSVDVDKKRQLSPRFAFIFFF